MRSLSSQHRSLLHIQPPLIALMDDIFDEPEFDLAGSRSGSAVLSSVPPTEAETAPAPSELRTLLAEHIFDVNSAYLDSLEGHLNSLGIVNLRHLASLNQARQHDDQIARALWSEVFIVFGSKPSLQQWQFTKAIQEADRLARTPSPSLLPPAAAAAAAAAMTTNASPPSVTSPVLTRAVLAQRLCRALRGAATWHVPDSIWNAFFSSRNPVPNLHTAVILDTAHAHPRITCAMCTGTFAVHYKNNSWSVSTLLDHLKNQHTGVVAPGTPSPDSNKRGANTLQQNDQYWRKFRRTSAPEPAAPTLPAPFVISRPRQHSPAVPAPPPPVSDESHTAAPTPTAPATDGPYVVAGVASSAPLAPDPESRS